mmetsp:Transcript_44330/g.77343  ORF Transcript_44330/g.77343 Transcript_44330/m.77343 type:complete len:289 (-) Transcript_44330:720-1586(-)
MQRVDDEVFVEIAFRHLAGTDLPHGIAINHTNGGFIDLVGELVRVACEQREIAGVHNDTVDPHHAHRRGRQAFLRFEFLLWFFLGLSLGRGGLLVREERRGLQTGPAAGSRARRGNWRGTTALMHQLAYNGARLFEGILGIPLVLVALVLLDDLVEQLVSELRLLAKANSCVQALHRGLVHSGVGHREKLRMFRRRVGGDAGGVAQIFHVTKMTSRAHIAREHILETVARRDRDFAFFEEHNRVTDIPLAEDGLASHGLERLQSKQQGHYKLHLVGVEQLHAADVVFV